MDFVCKLYGNAYAVHVTVALVGVATSNLALPPPPPHDQLAGETPPYCERNVWYHFFVSYKAICISQYFQKICEIRYYPFKLLTNDITLFVSTEWLIYYLVRQQTSKNTVVK